MRIALIIVVALLGIIIFFWIPYSPVGAEFKRVTDEAAKNIHKETAVFSEADLQGLPAPLQRYLSYCGYLGKPKMDYMRASLTDVDFIMSETRTIKIGYQQFNLVEKPVRFAFIRSSLFGIPFEGLDSFINARGSMQGKLAKVVPLFNQQGTSMDQACLVTWLAECLLVPNAALQDFVKWEVIDDRTAKAAITWEDINAEGVFSFAENGELLSFRTSDRVAVDMDGKETIVDWSAYFSEYYLTGGILQPKIIQSVWHYESGDSIYFNQNLREVTISYR